MSDIYVNQAGSGTQDGSSASNAYSVAHINFLNNNNVFFSPGDTIHIVGVISTEVLFGGNNGSSGNVITVHFEAGAKLSQPAGTLMNAQNVSYFCVDGGTNGIMENTANGTALANQVVSGGIYASGSSHLEIKNILIQNLYVHTSTSDDTLDFQSTAAVYIDGFGNGISVHDCVMHDLAIGISGAGASGASVISIYNNTFYNTDHAFEGIGGVMASPANVSIYNNSFGSTENWDTLNDAYHHDGIFIYSGGTGSLSGVSIYDNIFNGNWGNNNTAHCYIANDTFSTVDSVSNVLIYNNIFEQYTGNLLSDGFITGGGPTWSVFNNTFIGSGVTNSSSVTSHGTNFSFKNNIITGVTVMLNLGTGSTLASGGLNNNIYFNATAGGNPLFSFLGTGYSSLGAWQTATGQDASSTTSMPTLTGSYAPSGTDTVAKGQGVDLSSIFTTDFNGVTRSDPWDIGALTYSGYLPKTATPTASPAAGTYSSTQTVTLSNTDSAPMWYTTDGSDPVIPTTGGSSTLSGLSSLSALTCP